MTSSCAISLDGTDEHIVRLKPSLTNMCREGFSFVCNESHWKKLPMSDKIEESGKQQEGRCGMIEQKPFFRSLDERTFNPMNDVAFKFIFGKEESKRITIDFLNAVLEKSLGHEIKDITFRQSEMFPDGDEGKMSRLDIVCALDTGELVDVEVQVVNQQNMQRRTLFYWSRLYMLSLTRGGDYDILRPAITINLLAFEILPQDDPVAMYSIYNIENGDRLNNDMELYFIELPKYEQKPKKSIRESTKMERWLAYFANKMTDQEREELAMSEAAIREAMEAERIFLSDPDAYLSYVNRQMAIMDFNTNVKYALKEGREKGLIEGRAEGENRMAQLLTLLYEKGEMEEARQAAMNAEMRQRLYEKYHIE